MHQNSLPVSTGHLDETCPAVKQAPSAPVDRCSFPFAECSCQRVVFASNLAACEGYWSTVEHVAPVPLAVRQVCWLAGEEVSETGGCWPCAKAP